MPDDPAEKPELQRLDLSGRAGFLHRGDWRLAAAREQTLKLQPIALAEVTARRAIREWLADLEPEAREDAVLMVCELVSNAVRHAPGEEERVIELHLARADGVLRVEVCDGGPPFEPRLRTPGAHGGFGLLLIDRLSSRWGAAPDSPSCLWFELDLDATADAAA